MAFLTTDAGMLFVLLLAFFAGLFAWNTVQGYIRAMNAPNETVMFKHPTDVVPADVVNKASQAQNRLRFWTLAIGLGIYVVLIRPRFPEFAAALEEGLMSLVMLLLDVAITVLDGLQQLLARLV